MQIHVLYFAVARERTGRSEDTLELPAGARVRDALDALDARHDALRPLRPALQVAVNQEMSPPDRELAPGDELALIPPVAGGAAARHARVLSEPISLDRVIAAVSAPGMGGIVTFTGLVRDHNDGHRVERLEYEAYAPMAEKVFAQLCDEIESFYPGTHAALEHRTGALAIGDLAVVIAVAAPHRAAAFRACHELIDRLKERAPIWKKEIGENGSSWVGTR